MQSRLRQAQSRFPKLLSVLLSNVATIDYERCTRAEGCTRTSKKDSHLCNIFGMSSSTPWVHLKDHCRECFLSHSLSHRLKHSRFDEAWIDAINVDVISGILEGTCPSHL